MMNKIITILLGSLVAIYCASLLVFTKDVSAAQPRQKAKVAEYTDNEYGYAFQFPSDWKILKTPTKDVADVVRVVIRSPKASTLTVTVGKLGSSLSKWKLINDPDSKSLTNKIIDNTIDSVYEKFSRDSGATRMVIGEKSAFTSEMGLTIFISAVHIVKKAQVEVPVATFGMHCIPFEKDYMIVFIIINPVSLKAEEENENIKRVLNSFHLIGEKQIGNRGT